jgi:hypothetical protein
MKMGAVLKLGMEKGADAEVSNVERTSRLSGDTGWS